MATKACRTICQFCNARRGIAVRCNAGGEMR